MKIIFIDWSIFIHKSIFAWKNRKNIPATYTALNMLLANLKQLYLTPDDMIILAIDSHRNSWRKKLDSAYKANRKEKRDKDEEIDWKYQFREFDRILKELEVSTPFQIIKCETCEADDVISVGVRRYKDNECIIVSTDSDYEQLCCFDNVKLYSPTSKKFKIVKNPYKALTDKIPQEKTDNLITKVTNLREYNIRYQLVSLISLPKQIEKIIGEVYDKVTEKDYDITKFPYNSLGKRFMDIYNQKPKVIKRKKKKEKDLNIVSLI